MNLSEIGAVCITALTGFRERELGSINDWIQSGSDPTHWAYEPMTWNYEFEQEIRIEDPESMLFQSFKITGIAEDGGQE